MNTLLESFKEKYKVTPIDMKEFHQMKVGPMKFLIEAYDVEGIGRLSYMQGTAMLGLMKMDTIMLTPLYKDVVLFSYDQIMVMKNDTFIIEMYQTSDGVKNYPCFEELKAKYMNLPKYELKPAWYDAIRVPGSIAIKTKKQRELCASILKEYTKSLIDVLEQAKTTTPELMKPLQDAYVSGLLEHGGASTNQFIKAIGKEKTEILYRDYLFGTR